MNALAPQVAGIGIASSTVNPAAQPAMAAAGIQSSMNAPRLQGDAAVQALIDALEKIHGQRLEDSYKSSPAFRELAENVLIPPANSINGNGATFSDVNGNYHFHVSPGSIVHTDTNNDLSLEEIERWFVLAAADPIMMAKGVEPFGKPEDLARIQHMFNVVLPHKLGIQGPKINKFTQLQPDGTRVTVPDSEVQKHASATQAEVAQHYSAVATVAAASATAQNAAAASRTHQTSQQAAGTAAPTAGATTPPASATPPSTPAAGGTQKTSQQAARTAAPTARTTTPPASAIPPSTPAAGGTQQTPKQAAGTAAISTVGGASPQQIMPASVAFAGYNLNLGTPKEPQAAQTPTAPAEPSAATQKMEAAFGAGADRIRSHLHHCIIAMDGINDQTASITYNALDETFANLVENYNAPLAEDAAKQQIQQRMKLALNTVAVTLSNGTMVASDLVKCYEKGDREFTSETLKTRREAFGEKKTEASSPEGDYVTSPEQTREIIARLHEDHADKLPENDGSPLTEQQYVDAWENMLSQEERDDILAQTDPENLSAQSLEVPSGAHDGNASDSENILDAIKKGQEAARKNLSQTTMGKNFEKAIAGASAKSEAPTATGNKGSQPVRDPIAAAPSV